MNNFHRTVAAVLLPILFLLQGCNSFFDTDTRSNTLIVDLGVVARAIGKDTEIRTTIDQTRTQLNSRLEALLGKLNNELDKAKTQLDKKPSRDAQANYRELADRASTRLQQSRKAAELQVNTLKNRLFIAFRDHVRKVASGIARKRGAPMIQLAGADVLWFDPENDITDEVIARLRAQTETNTVTPSSGNESTDSSTQKETEKLNALVDQVKDKP